MKKNLISLAVAATLSIAALSASAEDMYRGAWYAVPGVSYMDTDRDLAASNGGGVSLKLGKELSQSWDIQGGLGYNRANTDVADADGHYKQTTLGLDALYMFSRDQFRPFVLAGLGVARNNVDYSITANPVQGKTKTSWLANVGIGAQYLINDTFGLQADLRHQWTRSAAKAANVFDADGTVGNTLLSLGGIFRFGAPAPMPVVDAVESAPLAVVATTPAAVVAPTPLPVIEACKPTLETVTISSEKLFGFDQSKLQEAGKAALNDVAGKIKGNPDVELVMVTGHTDRIGSDAYNQKLSERRANQVKSYLVSQGVEATRLEAVGKGESEPVVACTGVKGKNAIECLSPNRRVVISAEKVRSSGCK